MTRWDLPKVIAAPMAGGASTPHLVAAVGEAGGLGFLAGGYKSADALEREINVVRSLTALPFGVNLFVPSFALQELDDDELERRQQSVEEYGRAIAGDAARLGVALGEARPFDDDAWSAKLKVLRQFPCPVVSFTFGVPPAGVMSELRSDGILVIVTVTSRAEALAAGDADVLCVQGPDAGGHRGTHDPYAEPTELSLPELLRDIRDLGPALIAAGGITRRAQAEEAMAAGASAVQCGTMFLRAPESGASEQHKLALAAPWAKRTVLTRAFSGRSARGIENSFIRDNGELAPSAYPEVNQLTQPLRAAAAAAADPDRMALWAGTGFRDAESRRAAEITSAIQAWL